MLPKVNSDWTFVYSGVPHADMACKGVGFLLNRPLHRAWQAAGELCEFGGPRLLRIRILLRGRFFSRISCYMRPRLIVRTMKGTISINP